MRVTDGCEIDRLFFGDKINSDQHWAAGKLAEAVARANGVKSCLANIERTSGGDRGDRRIGAVWQLAKAIRSVEISEGREASRLLLDTAMDTVVVDSDRLPLLRKSLDALSYYYGLGRWGSFSLRSSR